MKAALTEASRADLTLTKALAILLVVVDHNDALRAVSPELFPALTFHVIAFFYASHAATRRNQSGWLDFVRQRVPRYMRPHLVFYGLFAAVSLVLGRQISPEQLVTGLMLADFAYIKMGCGAYLMWYLPALVTFVLLDKLLCQLHLLGSAFLLGTMALICLHSTELQVIVGGYANVWGFGAACYALVCCRLIDGLLRLLIAFHCTTTAFRLLACGTLLAVVAMAFQANQNALGTIVEVGAFQLPSNSDLASSGRVAGTNVFGVTAMVLLGQVLRPALAQSLAQHTLEIFLTHQFWLVPMLIVADRLQLLDSHALVVGLLSTFLAIGGSLRFTLAIKHRWSGFHGWVFGKASTSMR